MGNSSKQSLQPSIQQPVYIDPGVRTIRQLQTFVFPQTVTGNVTVSLANEFPKITQGNELWSGLFTATSLQSLIEVEAVLNFKSASGATYYIGLYADYSPDPLTIYGGSGVTGFNTIVVKEFFRPVTQGSVRYSLRSAASNTPVVINEPIYFPLNRGGSRITFTEYSGPSLQNI